jgi:hypothetical protein
VAAAAHTKQEAVLTRKPHGTNDVCGPSATDNRAGVAVDHRIPDRAGLIIARLPGQADIAPQRLAKGRYRIASKRNGPALQQGQPDLRHGISSVTSGGCFSRQLTSSGQDQQKGGRR